MTDSTEPLAPDAVALATPAAAEPAASTADVPPPEHDADSMSDIGDWGPKKRDTMDALLRRMRHQSDFPALSDSVSAINQLTNSEKESIYKLSSVILKDFGLTNKILRIVNSVYYRQVGGGSISTVSRAAIVLGFDAIRNLAVTVVLFEHLGNRKNASLLKEAFLRTNYAGLLAREAEEAYICGLFFGLGKLLTNFYFPTESEEIDKLGKEKKCGEEAAAARVLGLSYEDIGLGIARSWGFPRAIVSSMRHFAPGAVRKPEGPAETLHVMVAFANEICEALARSTPETMAGLLRQVRERFATGLGLSEKHIKEAMSKSLGDLAQVAAILKVSLKHSPFAHQVRAATGQPMPEVLDESAEVLRDTLVLKSCDCDGDDESGQPVAEDAQTILAAGIQDISNSLVEGATLNDILRITLETMYRAMNFQRVLLCLRDARAAQMVGRFGFGPDAAEVAKGFKFSMSFSPDVFHAAISKGVDIYIADVADPKIEARIPTWYKQSLSAQTFVIFPLLIKSNPVALIYCDKEVAGDIVIHERELSLLKTLRNQALLAIKQSA